MGLNLKNMVGKLTPQARRALEGAAGLCQSRSHYEVACEHWLVKLAEQPAHDLARICEHYEIAPEAALRGLERGLADYKTGNSGRASLSAEIEDLLQAGWLRASIEYQHSRTRSGVIFLAALADRVMGRRLRDNVPDLARINVEDLAKRLPDLVAGCPEDREVFHQAGGATAVAGAPRGAAGAGARATPALDQFTVDMTEEAKQGRMDPILGRDREIRQIVDILTRRRQNNPILTGEAGVGKTAVVEGFAQRVAAGDVPEPLRGVMVKSLDLGLLQAGAGVKGEFENRLKQVIEEVHASPISIILFIDEAHTLIGAGGQAGQNDAANLLKPALARGGLRTIAATTWAEYKKYFEKDPALARRFQVVKIDEPSEAVAIEMMRSLAPKLEKHHGVHLLDEAVCESVRLSLRYLPARQLPDKSVSVLDTACARVAIGQGAIPEGIENRRSRLNALGAEAAVLAREAALGEDRAARLAAIAAEREAVAVELAAVEARWEKEKSLVTEICELRVKLHGGEQESEAADTNTGADETGGKQTAKGGAGVAAVDRQALLDRYRACQRELVALQGEEPLVSSEVDGQAVAAVISSWTGIPVGRMVADEIQTVLELPARLEQRVIGQTHALEAIAQRIRTSRANLDNPSRPVGVFLLVGPSGVGKTETALALSELLYGGERNLISINMSEYQEAHTVSSLKGSPPGYVGYGEGGVLTEAVRRRPYSVVLLDEVEKAHPDVMELFFQVFDKGVLEDGEGREIDFKNTVILLTSNMGTELTMSLCQDPDTMPAPEALAEALRPEILKCFPPALLGRMIVVPFYPLHGEALRKIVGLQVRRIAKRMLANHGAEMVYDDSLLAAIAERCQDPDSGARAVDHILTRSLLPEVSAEFLARMARNEAFRRVKISLGASGFEYDIS
ncbi:MAG: type VI secretion system ATPase TssH [Candidatus Krumholzibacteria bacterium]|jgi:type VI secretion system protein VasG|nr:type VI secretion system ATPase TssH [Candidatus Krumholzibacteria bacterium]